MRLLVRRGRIWLSVIFVAVAAGAGCGGSTPGPSPTTTTTTTSIPTTTTTSTTTSTTTTSPTTSTTSTSTSSTSTTTTSAPNFNQFYGTYQIRVTKTSDTGCDFIAADSGTVALSGNADGSNFKADVSDRGGIRSYTGQIQADGSFSGNGSGLTPGSLRPAHEFRGSITGKVTGASISGAENMVITSGCPNNRQDTVVLSFSGNK